MNEKFLPIRHPALPGHPGCSVSLTLGNSLKNTLHTRGGNVTSILSADSKGPMSCSDTIKAITHTQGLVGKVYRDYVNASRKR
jgi:hypothetical protein